MPIYKSKFFPESALAHQLLDGLEGLEIGGSAHNAFGLNTRNVDYTDDMTTVFKLQEIALSGEAMPVDIVANGDALPLPDKSVDFVISSHVIEHFWDPIKAIKEWIRISKKYVYIICPQRDALESDKGRELTSLLEFTQRHLGQISPPQVDDHRHWSVWDAGTFVAMCEYYYCEICNVQLIDDKVGNGFAVVIDVERTENNKILLGYK